MNLNFNSGIATNSHLWTSNVDGVGGMFSCENEQDLKLVAPVTFF